MIRPGLWLIVGCMLGCTVSSTRTANPLSRHPAFWGPERAGTYLVLPLADSAPVELALPVVFQDALVKYWAPIEPGTRTRTAIPKLVFAIPKAGSVLKRVQRMLLDHQPPARLDVIEAGRAAQARWLVFARTRSDGELMVTVSLQVFDTQTGRSAFEASNAYTFTGPRTAACNDVFDVVYHLINAAIGSDDQHIQRLRLGLQAELNRILDQWSDIDAQPAP